MSRIKLEDVENKVYAIA